jgi:hypothetical protein
MFNIFDKIKEKFREEVCISDKKEEEIFILSRNTPQNKPTVPENYYLDKTAFQRAVAYIMECPEQWFRGYSNDWRQEKFSNMTFNNSLFLPELGLKIYRYFDFKTGLYSEKAIKARSIIKVGIWNFKHFPLNVDGRTQPGWLNTYCNHLVSVFSYFYTGFSLCYFREQWYSANTMHKALMTGGYLMPKFRFQEVSHNLAVDYAKLGGLAISSWENPNPDKPCHVAVLTGYKEDETPGGVEIFQAGLYFGKMRHDKGFGKSNSPKSKFFILLKR